MKKRAYISIFYLLILFSVSSFAQTVSGTITTAGGSPISDVTVTITTSDRQFFSQTTTDSNGYYALPGVNMGLVIPSKDNYYFNPMEIWLSTFYSNLTVNFIGTAVSSYYTISGTIKYSDGAPFGGLVIGVNATANNNNLFTKTTTTDDNGFYIFSDLPNGITISTSPLTTPGYSFEPDNMTFNDLDSDKADVDFIATLLPFYSISGTVKDSNGAPISGIALSISSSINFQSIQTITDSNGYYIFSDLPGGNTYTLAIGNSLNYSFQPRFTIFQNLSSDQIVNFIGTKNPFYSISGTIKDTSGAPISDVIVDLRSAGLTTQRFTDNNGYYIFSDLPVGYDCRVTPSKDNYYFDPYDRDIVGLNSDQTADFIGIEGPRPNFFNISGTITDTGGTPLSGVTVELNDRQGVEGTLVLITTTTTDNNGYYIFSDLPAGGRYTYLVTPSPYSKHYFEPSNISFPTLYSNRTADFIAKQGYDISGVIKDVYGTSISNVTLTGIVTGAFANQTTISDIDGYYILLGLPGSGYCTVMPYHPHYNFEPQSITFNFLLELSDKTANFVAYSTVSVDNITELPTSYSLSQNYPNPFNPTTKIEYSLPEASMVKLSVYNSLGQDVTKLIDEYQGIGKYSVDFNANNLPSGIYFYKLQSNKFNAVKKMMLLK